MGFHQIYIVLIFFLPKWPTLIYFILPRWMSNVNVSGRFFPTQTGAAIESNEKFVSPAFHGGCRVSCILKTNKELKEVHRILNRTISCHKNSKEFHPFKEWTQPNVPCQWVRTFENQRNVSSHRSELIFFGTRPSGERSSSISDRSVLLIRLTSLYCRTSWQ